MRARAPGKVVLSGAYVVLEGAPALVSAVDRYVVADATRPADFRAPEVLHALGGAEPPWFDASELRSEGRKLGLGSSAAILAASLAAERATRDPHSAQDPDFATRILQDALTAHRAVQGGGSGVDVVASVLGGTLAVQRAPATDLVEQGPCHQVQADSGHALRYRGVSLPPQVQMEVWAAASAASTAAFLEKTARFKATQPEQHTRLFTELHAAACAAMRACITADAALLLDALGSQRDGLHRLGEHVGAPIVTEEVRALNEVAQSTGGLVLPAGAGGGDVCLHVGLSPSSAAFRSRAETLRHTHLSVHLGAPGLSLLPQAPKEGSAP